MYSLCRTGSVIVIHLYRRVVMYFLWTENGDRAPESVAYQLNTFEWDLNGRSETAFPRSGL